MILKKDAPRTISMKDTKRFRLCEKVHEKVLTSKSIVKSAEGRSDKLAIEGHVIDNNRKPTLRTKTQPIGKWLFTRNKIDTVHIDSPPP